MIKNTLAVILISSAIYASPIDTDTSFVNVDPTEGKDGISKSNGVYYDKHGSVIVDKKVTIETKNYKVDNFWSKFSFNGTGKEKDEFTSIATTGTVRTIVEATSICTLYDELDTGGCSGQKPFLINNEAIDGKSVGDTISLVFQKDYDLSTDVILYSDINESVFYPLDIDRTEKYYKSQADNTKSFFGIFSMMFNVFFGDGGFFSSFFNHTVVDKNNINSDDIRQRYIANIISGVDQDHLLVKAVTPLETTAINNPVSLIDYTEDITSAGSCSLFIFKFSESSMFCNFMGGMPFISMFVTTKPTTSYEIDTIQTDTENSLITFASSYTGMNITQYQNGTVYAAQSDVSSFLNPISMMMNMMKCFFFGCSGSVDTNTIEEPMDTYYKFDGDTAVNITMAVTNSGTAIDDFQTFKLTGIHSLTGSEHMCRVTENNSYDTWSDYTFKPDGTTSKTFTSITTTGTETWCHPWFGADHLAPCNAFESSYTKNVESVDTTLKTPQEWLEWCDTAIENNLPTETTTCIYSLFDFFHLHPICTTTIDPIVVDGYTIEEYVNASKRGLILDLELTELNTSSKAVTLRYKLMSTN